MKIVDIPFEDLVVSPLNVRKRHLYLKLDELKKSIKRNGILQNLVVRKEGEYFGIISGQRRYLAVQALRDNGEKMDTLPCLVRDLSDLEGRVYSLSEALLNEDIDLRDRGEAVIELYNMVKDINEVMSLTGLPLDRIRFLMAHLNYNPSADGEGKPEIKEILVKKEFKNGDTKDIVIQMTPEIQNHKFKKELTREIETRVRTNKTEKTPEAIALEVTKEFEKALEYPYRIVFKEKNRDLFVAMFTTRPKEKNISPRESGQDIAMRGFRAILKEENYLT